VALEQKIRSRAGAKPRDPDLEKQARKGVCLWLFIARASLYKSLANKANPNLITISRVVKALGCKLDLAWFPGKTAGIAPPLSNQTTSTCPRR
jgi:hypothetical protein